MRRTVLVLSIMLAAVFLTGPGAWAATPPTCTDSLQARIKAAPNGTQEKPTVVTANGCVYREQVDVVGKQWLVLRGVAGSEIRGSDVWAGWRLQPDGTYRSTNVLPDKFATEDPSCISSSDDCSQPEQVFRDGQPLRQGPDAVDPATLAPNEFSVGASGKINVNFDPAGKLMEVSTRRHWITGGASSDHITIDNIDMRHAATDWRCGGVQNRPATTVNDTGTAVVRSCRSGGNDGSDWNLTNSSAFYAHGADVSLRGTGIDIIDNEIAYGGQLGIHNVKSDSRILRNNIHHNNFEGFCKETKTDCVSYNTDGNSTTDPAIVESGGMKVGGGGTGIDINANDVHDNYGHGVWVDEGGGPGIEIASNRIYNNERNGVWYEISDGGDIHNNRLWENGWGGIDTTGGAGIAVGNSDTTSVHDNALARNKDGVDVICADRGASNVPASDVKECIGNSVDDNTYSPGDRHTGAPPERQRRAQPHHR